MNDIEKLIRDFFERKIEQNKIIFMEKTKCCEKFTNAKLRCDCLEEKTIYQLFNVSEQLENVVLKLKS